jgi:hypothetical protein
VPRRDIGPYPRPRPPRPPVNWLRFAELASFRRAAGRGCPGFVRGSDVSSPATRHPSPATRPWVRSGRPPRRATTPVSPARSARDADWVRFVTARGRSWVRSGINLFFPRLPSPGSFGDGGRAGAQPARPARSTQAPILGSFRHAARQPVCSFGDSSWLLPPPATHFPGSFGEEVSLLAPLATSAQVRSGSDPIRSGPAGRVVKERGARAHRPSSGGPRRPSRGTHSQAEGDNSSGESPVRRYQT